MSYLDQRSSYPSEDNWKKVLVRTHWLPARSGVTELLHVSVRVTCPGEQAREADLPPEAPSPIVRPRGGLSLACDGARPGACRDRVILTGHACVLLTCSAAANADAPELPLLLLLLLLLLVNRASVRLIFDEFVVGAVRTNSIVKCSTSSLTCYIKLPATSLGSRLSAVQRIM